MGKRILITSTDLMMIQFLVPHVQNLAEHGYEVEIACSEVGGRMNEVREKLKDYTRAIHTVRLVRSPASLTNLKGYQDMKQVINTGKYDIIWTNEPVMGVVTRLAARAARKSGTKVLYMVHGFHFYKGAPLVNWMVYYPVERWASRFCDEIVTINKEDYGRAKQFHAREIRYIHGIGVDTTRLQKKERQHNIRQELKFQKDDFMILSVGELTKRKNHQVVIRALGEIRDQRIQYLVCGKGKLQDKLQKLSKKQGIEKNVHFLGYRNDVVDICSQADLFVLSSLHEGLSIASLEAMYCGLPIIISDIRGVRDYLEDGVNGYICKSGDVSSFAKAIVLLKKNQHIRESMSNHNRIAVCPYTVENVKVEILELMNRIEDE